MTVSLDAVPTWFPWNGSKRWLLNHLAPALTSWNGRGRYIDPFVGGGSVSAMVRVLFPAASQRLSDANPWLVSAFQSQRLRGQKIAENYVDVWYWRGLRDTDIGRLSLLEQANRFAVCLLTAWGNRWKSQADGSMGTENPVNKKFVRPDYLKKRMESFFAVEWLTANDQVTCVDWKEAVQEAMPGDLVYIDPPYPESLGYGNHWWSFSDQLDVVDWVTLAAARGVKVVVSNMATIERLYRRAGLQTVVVDGPKVSKTRTVRKEVVAWC